MSYRTLRPFVAAILAALTVSLAAGMGVSTSASGLVTDAETVDPRCVVTEATKLVENGGNGEWSQATDQLVYNKIDEAGIYQVQVSDPDGNNARCITCSQAPGAPGPSRHKFNPAWHPSGQYIVMQGELRMHVLEWFRTTPIVTEMLLNGLWSDMYVATADGSQWYKLTNTAVDIHDGVLHPNFSQDGQKIVWSRIIGRSSTEYPFGRWKLMVADFVVAGGTPRLENVRDITPDGGTFHEAHGFSPDGNSVIFTSDIESTATHQKRIWTMDLATGELRNLTPNTHWNEHAVYTPGGDKVTYMSSEPYGWSYLTTDLMLVPSGGGEALQLTHFNVPDYPEYGEYQSMATQSSWNAAGTRLAVTQQMKDGYPAYRNFWVLTFAGACGG